MNILEPFGHNYSQANKQAAAEKESSINNAIAILDGKRKGSQGIKDPLDAKVNQALLAKLSQTGVIAKPSNQNSAKNSQRSRNYKVKLTSGQTQTQ